MSGFKWAGILVGTLALALITLANVLVLTLTRFTVPGLVDDLAIGLATVSFAVSFSAHVYQQMNTKLDLMLELFVARIEDLENQVGDRNNGFVEGYLLRHTPEASVVPFTPRTARRGMGDG